MTTEAMGRTPPPREQQPQAPLRASDNPKGRRSGAEGAPGRSWGSEALRWTCGTGHSEPILLALPGSPALPLVLDTLGASPSRESSRTLPQGPTEAPATPATRSCLQSPRAHPFCRPVSSLSPVPSG